MKNIILLICFVFALQLAAPAYFMNTANLAGHKKMVLQAGFGSETSGAMPSRDKAGPLFMLVYGLSEPWDLIGIYSEGYYSNVPGRIYQAVSVQGEYGYFHEDFVEGTLPFDLTVLLGAELSKDVVTNSISAEETTLQIGLIASKNLEGEYDYLTPFGGFKFNLVSADLPANDIEFGGGVKYCIWQTWSAMFELDYHWIDRNGTKYNSLEWCLGGSLNI